MICTFVHSAMKCFNVSARIFDFDGEEKHSVGSRMKRCSQRRSNSLSSMLELGIDRSNNFVWSRIEVVAFCRLALAEKKFETKSIDQTSSKSIETFLTFPSRKSSNVRSMSRSHRDLPNVLTDEPNGRQTVSRKVLRNASEIDFIRVLMIPKTKQFTFDERRHEKSQTRVEFS